MSRIKELEAQAKLLRSQLSKIERELFDLKKQELIASGKLKGEPKRKRREQSSEAYMALSDFIINGSKGDKK